MNSIDSKSVHLWPLSLLLTALLLALGTAQLQAQPQAGANGLQRCVDADGRTIFTDRRCVDIGARQRMPVATGAQGNVERGAPRQRIGCARRLPDLLQDVSTAVASGNVNRLANSYHWVGTSGQDAEAILTRLNAVVQRSLLDIDFVYPASAVVDAQGNVIDANADGFYPQTSQRKRPVALRLEQQLAGAAGVTRLHFRLRRHMDCWWISF